MFHGMYNVFTLHKLAKNIQHKLFTVNQAKNLLVPVVYTYDTKMSKHLKTCFKILRQLQIVGTNMASDESCMGFSHDVLGKSNAG